MLDEQPYISDLVNYLQLEIVTPVILFVAFLGLFLDLIDALKGYSDEKHSAFKTVRSTALRRLGQVLAIILVAGVVILFMFGSNTIVSSIIAIVLCVAYAAMNGALVYQVFSSEVPRVINRRERLGFVLVPLMFMLLPWDNISQFVFTRAYELPLYGKDFILCLFFVTWFGFAVSSLILNLVIDAGIVRSWAIKHADKTTTLVIKTTLRISAIVSLILTHAIFSYDDVLSDAGVDVYMLIASAVIIPIIVSQVLEARERSSSGTKAGNT